MPQLNKGNIFSTTTIDRTTTRTMCTKRNYMYPRLEQGRILDVLGTIKGIKLKLLRHVKGDVEVYQKKLNTFFWFSFIEFTIDRWAIKLYE